VHLVRTLIDEVFGRENFVSQITVRKTSPLGAQGLPNISDFILWYAKDKTQMKFRQIYTAKSFGEGSMYTNIELVDGSRRKMTQEERDDPSSIPKDSRPYTLDNLLSAGYTPTCTYSFEFEGKTILPKSRSWKTNYTGMMNLIANKRIMMPSNTPRYVRYFDDLPVQALDNLWNDTGGVSDLKYVVQTANKVVQRCVLMTTDPGDLVIDPTCGSGTTAAVCEQWGRRWVTMDTSRVALAIARERLLTSKFDFFELSEPSLGVSNGFKINSVNRVTLGSIAKESTDEDLIYLYDQPHILRGVVRVSGPFTVEALSRYSVNPMDEDSSAPDQSTASSTTDHVEVLLDALKIQGIPRAGGKPYRIESLTPLAAAGALQAEGIMDADGKHRRFAVALGPKFGAVTMGQVSDAIREAVGFDLVVFAGFAVSADAQEKLATGKFGTMQVALLLANNDLLVGDLLKNTKSSQTFRLYSAPDITVVKGKEGYRVTVEGVDTFDAATGEVLPLGKNAVQAWFLDDDFDGTVFRVSQAFFPVTDSWEKLQRALKGTVDADKLGEMHGWTSLPFNKGENGRIAVRVIAQDGNASEVVRDDAFSVDAHGAVDLNSVK